MIYVIRHIDSGCLTESLHEGKLYLVELNISATKYETRKDCQEAVAAFYNSHPCSQDSFDIEEQ